MPSIPKSFVTALVVLSIFRLLAASPSWVISGNETKIDLTSGSPRRIAPAGPDSLTLMDFTVFPPRITHLSDVPNTVIGPPSNIAISPDGHLALVANSVQLDPANTTNWIPESYVALVDLTATPPRITGRVATGLQPSGISIRHDGKAALVANRAAGTLTVLALHGQRVDPLGEITVCTPADSLSDVAISPDGRTVLASVQKGGYLAVLTWDDVLPKATGQKISTYGQPYRVVITPDGGLALTAGAGAGNRLDRDAMTVVDLTTHPIRAFDYIALGAIPESIEISPDGRWVAAVVMEGSNLPFNDPNHSNAGRLVMLERAGRSFRIQQTIDTGRIPEGVTFTRDGRYVVVQCHADRELRIYELRRGKIRDTGYRVAVRGFPSSLRASP
jgi:DNA-binding beta-propeller fold protein YncE